VDDASLGAAAVEAESSVAVAPLPTRPCSFIPVTAALPIMLPDTILTYWLPAIAALSPFILVLVLVPAADCFQRWTDRVDIVVFRLGFCVSQIDFDLSVCICMHLVSLARTNQCNAMQCGLINENLWINEEEQKRRKEELVMESVEALAGQHNAKGNTDMTMAPSHVDG